jgi:hypothetical protein
VTMNLLWLLSALPACRHHEEDGPAVSEDCGSFWIDADGDSYGSTEVAEACEPGPGLATNALDCGDDDPDVHPGASDACNGIDEDCDGEDGEPRLWYVDADGDGFGRVEETASGCMAPEGYADQPTDCDDTDGAVNPGAEERCDNDVDDDCDGLSVHATDDDHDGEVSDTCTGGTDCDDTDPAVHTGAAESCGDGIDDDCSGLDLPCVFAGDYDLADASARLTCSSYGWETATLVETGDVTGDGKGDLLLATLLGDGSTGGGYLVPGPVTGDAAVEDVG